MHTQLEGATSAQRARAGVGVRVRALGLLGPLTVAGAVLWALVQPYRITLLHPHHQGFWWLVVEPPILAALAGVVFHRLVARPLLADLEAARGTES